MTQINIVVTDLLLVQHSNGLAAQGAGYLKRRHAHATASSDRQMICGAADKLIFFFTCDIFHMLNEQQMTVML